MGHIVHPVVLRLGFTRYWNSIWSVSDLKNYSNLINQDFLMKSLVFSFFNAWGYFAVNFIVNDIKLLRKSKRIFLFIYAYNFLWEDFLKDFYYTFFVRYRLVNLYKKGLKKRRNFQTLYKKANNKKIRVATFRKGQTKNSAFKKNNFKGRPLQKNNLRANSFFNNRQHYKYTNFNNESVIKNKKVLHLKFKKRLSLNFFSKLSKKSYANHIKSLFYFYIYYARLKYQKPFFQYLKSTLLFYLSRFCFINTCNFSIYFIGMQSTSITAAFIARFISIKLENSYFLFDVLRSVNRTLRFLIRQSFLQSYRIKISGRYSRKQLAVALINGKGALYRGLLDSRLDYAFNTAILKYSICGIKVWLVFCHQKSVFNKMLLRRNVSGERTTKSSKRKHSSFKFMLRSANLEKAHYLII